MTRATHSYDAAFIAGFFEQWVEHAKTANHVVPTTTLDVQMLEHAIRLLRSSGPLDALERAVVDAAMARLKKWHEQEPEGLLPPSHPRGLPNGTARDLIKASLALEKARLGATGSPIEKEKP